MKVILLTRVKGLGEAGALVEVAPGHARNLLFPQHLAVEATSSNLARREAELAKAARESAKERQRAEDAGTRLEGETIVLKAKAGSSGRLFGSITAQDIASAITQQYQIEVDRRRIDLPEPFKALGDHRVTLRLHPEVTAHVNVRIESV